MARTADPELRVVVGSRLFDAAPVSPVWIGLALALKIFALYLGTGFLFHAFADARDAGTPLWQTPDVREKLILALLLGWALASERMARSYLKRFLHEVGERAGWSEDRRASVTAEVFRSERRPRAWAAFWGLGVGLTASYFTGPAEPGADFYLAGNAGAHAAFWELFLNVGVCVLFALGIETMLRLVRRATAIGGDTVDFDLLDRTPLLLFTKLGIRTATLWIVGGSLVALLFANWGFHWVTLIGFLGTVGMASSVLAISLRAARDAIHAAKRRALDQVNTAIQRDRGGALDPALPDGAGAAARLPGLLAYREFVAGVPEWPFDASTITRMTLLAAVALGSWLGGALVERALGLALD